MFALELLLKEPEELVYLFLAIAIGLGYGAGHTLITTILVLSILAVIYIWLSNRIISNTSEYNLVINWKSKNVAFNNILVAELIKPLHITPKRHSKYLVGLAMLGDVVYI